MNTIMNEVLPDNSLDQSRNTSILTIRTTTPIDNKDTTVNETN